MTFRPKFNRRQPKVSPPPRTHEFVPYPESDAAAVTMAEVERLLIHAETTTTEPADAVQSLCRAARLLEGDPAAPSGSDPERAFFILGMAFRRAHADAEVTRSLERMAERMGRWEELISIAEQVMLEVDEPTALGQLWAQVARWSRRLQRWDKALEAGESALALAPDDEHTFAELEEIYRHLGHHGPLARLLARRARVLSAAGSAESRAELLEIQLELASLYEDHLGDDEQAIAACERAFNLDSSNTAALTRLERLAEKHNRRVLLVDVLERRLTCASTPGDRRAVAVRLAAAWASLSRLDNACRVLGTVLAETGEDADILRALAGHYRIADEWAFLAEVLVRLQATGVPRDEARAISRELGELYGRTLDRPDEAVRLLVPLLAEDPADVKLARLLAALFRKRRDWTQLGDLLLRAGRQAPTLDDRLSFLREAVRVYATRLSDHAGARTALRLILEADPTDQEALEELVAETEARQDWSGMRALVSAVLPHAEGLPPERIGQMHDWLALAADGLGDRGAAMAHRRQAVAVCPDQPAYVRALALTLADQGHLVEALPHLEWLWEHPLDTDSDLERGELAFRRGRAWLAHGNRANARTALEQSVQLASESPEAGYVEGALEALGTLALEDGDTAQAVRHKEKLLRVIDEAPRRVALCTELARLYQHDLGDRNRAQRVLKDGLALVPGSHQILHTLLELQVSGRAWRGAIDTLLTLAEGIDGPGRARYLATAARIAEVKLKAYDESTALFGRALDADPSAFEIFVRMDRALNERSAFSAQAHAYRSMITRIQGEEGNRAAAARRSLWRGLGEIYRSRLRDVRSAIGAYEQAAALDPSDGECRVIITELCEVAGPDTWGRAVGERRRMLASASSLEGMAPHLRSLHRLGLQMNHLDQAFRAGEALVAMGLATPEEHLFCERHPLPTQSPERPLTDGRWQKLRHDGQDPRLSLAFAAVGRALLVSRGRAARAWGLHEESPTEREESERSILAQMVAELTALMGAPQPQLRFRPDLPGTVDLAGVVARSEVIPTLVAGADMLQVRSRREILALVAKTATLLRWEHLVLWPTVVPNPVELQVAVLALRRLCGLPPLTPLRRSDARLVARLAESLRRLLTADELDRIASVASELDPAGVGPWVRGAVLTAGRAGLMASGDLTVALQLVRPESYGPLHVAPFEQVRDLITYSVSAEHIFLRRDLGLPSLDPHAPLLPPTDDITALTAPS